MADQVIVLLLANSERADPGAVRHRWLEEMFPWATVRSGVADHPVDYDDPAVSTSGQRPSRRSSSGDLRGRTPDIGAGLRGSDRGAAGRATVLVDPDRQTVPVSGTAIREDPYGELALPRARRASLVCPARRPPWGRSTGTTTMTSSSRSCSGRAGSQNTDVSTARPKDAAWRGMDDRRVRRGSPSASRRSRTKRPARPTGACSAIRTRSATALWHEHYLGRRAPEVEAIARSRKYDLTFLTAADFPGSRMARASLTTPVSRCSVASRRSSRGGRGRWIGLRGVDRAADGDGDLRHREPSRASATREEEERARPVG